MRYSLAFLGLIAFAPSAHSTSTSSSTTDVCQKGLQPFLAPLAKSPSAAKYCADKYCIGVSARSVVEDTEDVEKRDPDYSS